MLATSSPASAATRRKFLVRSAAIAGGVAAPLILTSRKSIVRASSFPSFNTGAIGTANLNNFTATFLAMANDMYHKGSTSTTNLSNASQYWGVLYPQLVTSGFDEAAVQYINAGVPDADPQLNPSIICWSRMACSKGGATFTTT